MGHRHCLWGYKMSYHGAGTICVKEWERFCNQQYEMRLFKRHKTTYWGDGVVLHQAEHSNLPSCWQDLTILSFLGGSYGRKRSNVLPGRGESAYHTQTYVTYGGFPNYGYSNSWMVYIYNWMIWGTPILWTSGNQEWQWKIPINGGFWLGKISIWLIWWIFDCHVWLPKGTVNLSLFICGNPPI